MTRNMARQMTCWFAACVLGVVGYGWVASDAHARPKKRTRHGQSSTHSAHRRSRAKARAKADSPATQAPANDASAGQNTAPPQDITVRVIEVAGNYFYIEPGANGRVVRNTPLMIGKKYYLVTESTETHAVVRASRTEMPSVGQKGVAKPTGELESAVSLKRAAPLDEFRQQWVEAMRPSAAQTPRYVPIDNVRGPSSRQRIVLTAGVSANIPTTLGTPGFTRTELRAAMHLEPVPTMPLRFDADVAVQKWFGRDLGVGERSRPLIRPYQLELGLGHETSWNGSMGRMRFAALTLGALDGVRVQTPSVSGFTLSGFGGLVPDPQNGQVSSGASRFGVEAAYTNTQSKLSPTASLVAHGSMFDGALDERRMTGSVFLFPKDARVSSFVELNMFDRDNPWNASTLEVGSAGVDGSVRVGKLSLSARADMRRPERSKWMASYFPQTWLCVPAAPTVSTGQPSTNEACSNYHQPRYAVTLDAKANFDRVVVSGGFNGVVSGYEPDSRNLGGFAGVQAFRLFDVLRAELSTQLVMGSWLNNVLGRVAVGSALLDDLLDVTVYYRPALIQYHRVDSTTWTEHAAGGSAWLSLSPRVFLQLNGEWIQGYDVGALLVQSFVTWRPL
jgi:hypothetical protein